MATQYLHTNNANSNLRTAITSVAATAIYVTSGTGVLFPTPGVNQGFFVTVEDRRTGRMEIMLCTAKSGDTLTVQRGKQGTVPQTFPVGVNVSNRLTAEVLDDFVSATIDMIPKARIPLITDDMMSPAGIDANKITTGVFAVGRIPPITNAMVAASGIDGAKIVGPGKIAVAALPAIPAANLPVIPPALLTSVPAASLTGTIAAARLPVIPPNLLTSVPAASLTGTIADARLPAAITATSVGVTTLAVSGSASIAGDLNVGGAIVADVITAQLYHPQYQGYVRIGSYSSTYSAGVGRFYYNARDQEFAFVSHASSALCTVAASSFRGGGTELAGVVKSAVGVEAGAILLGPGDGHSSGTIYNGSDLRTPYFRVNTSNNDLVISFGNGPGGKWRAMQSGSAAASERALGFFVRTE